MFDAETISGSCWLGIAHAFESTSGRYLLGVVRRQLRPLAYTLLLATVTVLATMTGAAAQVSPTSGVVCGVVKPADVTFLGTVRSSKNGIVVFTVDKVDSGTMGKNVGSDSRVSVIYSDQEEQFLKVGQQYQVPADSTAYGLVSSVHTANHKCHDNSTANPDGSVIATGVFAHAKGPLLRYAVQLTVGLATLFGLVTVLSLLARRARND